MSALNNLTYCLTGIAGVSFIAYCIYFDKKRRSDPFFKRKLKERRAQAQRDTNKNDSANLPDMNDPEAVQKFFLEEVQRGEECLATNDVENCIKHLTNAVAVCGQPQQLLGVFKKTLPPQVFQLLVQNLAQMGAAQIQKQSAAASTPLSSANTDTEVLD